MTSEIILSFITLSLLEIILGIDNLIFIALVIQKLPKKFANKARYIGLFLALFFRIAMMFGMVWIMSLTKPLFTIFSLDISFRDILLFAGGMFLIVKAGLEIYSDVSHKESTHKEVNVSQDFFKAIIQIVLIDLVFSFDSVITAIGMTTNVPVIIAAMTVAMLVMLASSGSISSFISKHPTFKILALSFILMIGFVLIAESLHVHVAKEYIYFSFAFCIFVESMNTLSRSRSHKKKKS